MLFSISFPTGLSSSDLSGFVYSRIEKAGKALFEIESQKGCEAAAGEIAIAWRWIADAKELIEAGKTEKSAEIAERLPFQLDLIRLVIATGVAAAKAKHTEQEVFELERKIKILKVKRDRLLLEKHGASVSGAMFPNGEVEQ